MPLDLSLTRLDLAVAANAAFKEHVARLGGIEPARRTLSVGARTIQRICRGDKEVPPGLAAEVADWIDRDDEASPNARKRAAALRAWADHWREDANG